MINFKLKNGKIYRIFDNRDLFDLLENELGVEIAEKIKKDYKDFEEELQEEERFSNELLSDKDEEISELQNRIVDLEKEIEELKEE